MAPPVEISIPSTVLSNDAKPYTLYNITLRLPLRTFVVQKRYSEFATFHDALVAQVGAAPPSTLPAKSWFKKTVSSPELTEQRRQGLETYLRSIAESPDRRWRDTTTWRAFLNLPSTTGAGSSRSEAFQMAGTSSGAAAVDPTVWLDVHRELKGQLHDARLHLGRRDNATTSQQQHEASASAKRSLVKAGGLIASLEMGLKAMSERDRGSSRASSGLGEGELRRRRDLLASAKVEKEGLEKLSASLASSRGQSGSSDDLSSQQGNGVVYSALQGPSRPTGRVLGGPIQETAQTKALDNEGVLQLQKQMMQNQDLDVEELAKIVRRQKEMGVNIYNELELQNEMLNKLNEDTDRVHGKIKVADKRARKL